MSNALTATLEARVDKLQQNFADAVKFADNAVRKIEESFASANPDAKGFIDKFTQSAEQPAKESGATIGKIFIGALAASTAGLAGILLHTLDALSDIGDKADELRLPVNLLQALGVAAAEARVPTEKLNSALEQFTKVSKEDSDGAETFYKALSNINQKFSEGFKNADTQAARLKILANAFKSTSDEVKRAQLAQEAFGSDSQKLIGVFSQGGAAIDDYIRKAEALGLKIDESLVKQSQEAKSQLLLLSKVLGDELSSSLTQLIPLLTSVIQPMGEFLGKLRDVLSVLQSDETKSISGLRTELDQLVDEWVRLRNAREAIASNTPGKFDGLRDQLRAILGISEDPAAEIEQFDKDITKVEQQIDRVKKLIASKQAENPVANAAPAFAPRPSLTDSGTGGRDRFEASADVIEKRTAALNAENKAIDLGTAAREKAKIAAQLETVAMQINKEAGLGVNVVTDEQRQKINALAEAYGKVAAAIENAHSPLATFGRDATNIGKQLNQFAATSLDNVTNALADIVTGTKTAAQAFKALSTSIISDLAKIAIKATITGPIAKGLFGALGGSVFNVGGGFPAFASGTDSAPGGWSWVGENGPELLNLPKGAQVVPNAIASKTNAGGGISVTNVIDARNIDPGLEARIMQRLPGVVAVATANAVKAVPQARRNNPGYFG